MESKFRWLSYRYLRRWTAIAAHRCIRICRAVVPGWDVFRCWAQDPRRTRPGKSWDGSELYRRPIIRAGSPVWKSRDCTAVRRRPISKMPTGWNGPDVIFTREHLIGCLRWRSTAVRIVQFVSVEISWAPIDHFWFL